MVHEIKVGRDNRVIETNDLGQIEFIDSTPVCEIEQEVIDKCYKALSEHEINDRYVNSQDLSMISDREADRAEQYINERRGK